MRARKSPFLLRGSKMKIMAVSIYLLFLSTHFSYSMDEPNQHLTRRKVHKCDSECTDCSIKCKAVLGTSHIPELRKSLIHELKIKINPYEGIGNLFIEEETAKPTKPAVVHKKFTKGSSNTSTAPLQHADSEPILSNPTEPQPDVKKNTITFLAYCDSLTKLVRQGASDILGLLKPETEGNAHHGLFEISEQLAQKSNEFPSRLIKAQQSEKSDPIFLRLNKIVAQAVTSTKKLAEKDPLLTYINNMNHPSSSYLTEIEILQDFLTQNK